MDLSQAGDIEGEVCKREQTMEKKKQFTWSEIAMDLSKKRKERARDREKGRKKDSET